MHNIFTKLEQSTAFIDPFRGFKDGSGNTQLAIGTLPADGESGYAVNAKFLRMDGAGVDQQIYINTGSTTSTTWTAATLS